MTTFAEIKKELILIDMAVIAKGPTSPHEALEMLVSHKRGRESCIDRGDL
jgi:hypothetical protein